MADSSVLSAIRHLHSFRSMEKVAVAGEDHRRVPIIGCFDHFFVADGATRLNCRSRTGIESIDEAVSKGEHCVARSVVSGSGRPSGERS